MAREPDIFIAPRRINRVRGSGAPIAGLAARQHGVVARWQLLRLGLSSAAIHHRLRTRYLLPIHTGVYAVGHPAVTRFGHWMAATLYGGPEAALSHGAAGAVHDLRAWSGRAAITVPKCRRSTAAIEIHGSRLPADEITVIDGIRMTSMPRTILDLAADLGRVGTEQAIAEAEARGMNDSLSLPDLLERYPGRRGNKVLRSILAERTAALGVTKGELEDWFQSFLIEHGLPRPELNAPMEMGGRRIRVDCLWRRQRVIVELDGHRWHDSPQQGDRDRARDRALLRRGYRVVRVTWAHLRDEPELVAADLRALLS